MSIYLLIFILRLSSNIFSSYVLRVIDSMEDKFLIFAHHKIMCDAIQQVITQRNKKFIRIDGGTTSEHRKFLIDKFQFDDSYICAILSITAANTGITLTKAKWILFAELHWNPSVGLHHILPI